MNRLRSPKEIQKVFQRGKRVRGHFMNLIFLPLPHRNPSRFAIAVGTKFGLAVKRNQTRRIIREVLRENYTIFPQGYDFVVEIFPQAKSLSREEIRRRLGQLFDKSLGILQKEINMVHKGSKN